MTYIVVLLLVVAVLYGSFRVLAGGGGARSAVDGRGVVRRLTDVCAQHAGELGDQLAMPGEHDGRPDPLVVTASEARKAFAGCQQRLAQIEVDDDGPDVDRLTSARTLLSAALDEYGWASRKIEAGTYRESAGVQRAVAALRDHADECLRAARDLVAE